MVKGTAVFEEYLAFALDSLTVFLCETFQRVTRPWKKAQASSYMLILPFNELRVQNFKYLDNYSGPYLCTF